MRILVVDDSRAVWERLLMLLAEIPQVSAIAHAVNLQEARRCLATFTPEWLVLDIQLPDGSGLDLLREVRHAHPGMRVVVFTNHIEFRQVGLDLGADWFIDKSLDFSGLLNLVASDGMAREAVRQISNGGN